ncbi:uncharacterized protein METZ01_LOCUS406102 [marine metagenome]|uniref:Uncharacterized protein n=1 Tax=marine metagenome TaxID=408172 RepID=A0A382W560_9ZZZZ
MIRQKDQDTTDDESVTPRTVELEVICSVCGLLAGHYTQLSPSEARSAISLTGF